MDFDFLPHAECFEARPKLKVVGVTYVCLKSIFRKILSYCLLTKTNTQLKGNIF